MTMKVKGTEGVEFPDSSVQSSAGMSQAAADAKYLPLTGGTLQGPLFAQQGTPFTVRAANSGDSALGIKVFRSDNVTIAGQLGTFSQNGVEKYSYVGCGPSGYLTGIKVATDGTMYRAVAGSAFANWGTRETLTQIIGDLADMGYLGMRWKASTGECYAGIDATPWTVVGVTSTMAFHVGTLSSAVMINGAGALTAKGEVSAYSDARLKTDLKVIPNALAKVMQLTGYTYTRIDTEQRQSGLLAQDVQAVLPEVVSADRDGTLALAYGNLVGLLVEAIKELKAEIEELKK